jgi:Domain of unknown function (DUF305)
MAPFGIRNTAAPPGVLPTMRISAAQSLCTQCLHVAAQGIESSHDTVRGAHQHVTRSPPLPWSPEMYPASLRYIVATLSDSLPRSRLSATIFGARLLVAFATSSHVLAHENHPATQSATAIAEAPFYKENAAAMDKMMAAMDVKPTGDIDRDFAAMMIPHHQGAIDMAVIELRYGKNEQLRRIAQEIIVDQMQEIAAMKLAIGESVTNSTPAPTQQEPASIAAQHHHSGMQMDMPR